MTTRLQDLPLETKLKLVEDLWDSIAVDQNKILLTLDQKIELDVRLNEFELDGELGEPAAEVLTQIRRTL